MQIVPSPPCLRQVVPSSDIVAGKFLTDLQTWHNDAINCVASTVTRPDGIYEATGESLYEAFWRTLCCNHSNSSTNKDQTPANSISYASWCKLIDIQQARVDSEAKISWHMKVQIWGLWIAATASISALTYYFRKNRLLVVTVPFALPPLVRFINTVYKSGMEIVRIQLTVRTIRDSEQVQIEQRDFENSFSQCSQGRQFGVTRKGLLGWFPLIAKPGDFVGLFGGCRIPYALRAVDHGFKIVGDAYIHGVMNGEGEQNEGELVRVV